MDNENLNSGRGGGRMYPNNVYVFQGRGVLQTHFFFQRTFAGLDSCLLVDNEDVLSSRCLGDIHT